MVCDGNFAWNRFHLTRRALARTALIPAVLQEAEPARHLLAVDGLGEIVRQQRTDLLEYPEIARVIGPQRPPCRMDLGDGRIDREQVGEIGFFANIPRTANVIAIRDSSVLVLTRAAVEKLEARFNG